MEGHRQIAKKIAPIQLPLDQLARSLSEDPIPPEKWDTLYWQVVRGALDSTWYEALVARLGAQDAWVTVRLAVTYLMDRHPASTLQRLPDEIEAQIRIVEEAARRGIVRIDQTTHDELRRQIER